MKVLKPGLLGFSEDDINGDRPFGARPHFEGYLVVVSDLVYQAIGVDEEVLLGLQVGDESIAFFLVEELDDARPDIDRLSGFILFGDADIDLFGLDLPPFGWVGRRGGEVAVLVEVHEFRRFFTVLFPLLFLVSFVLSALPLLLLSFLFIKTVRHTCVLNEKIHCAIPRIKRIVC